MLPDVEHVVILMMENHSFDDHFGRLGRGDGLKVASDGSPLNYNPAPDGGYILSFPMPNTAMPVDSKIGQNWNTSHLCWDHGTNMGFARNCGPASMGHFTGAQLPFYYSLASHFPIGDRYFSSVMAQTYPNRRFLIAATALGDVATDGTGISSKDAPNGTIFDRLDSYNITLEGLLPRPADVRAVPPRVQRQPCTTADWPRSTTSSPMQPPGHLPQFSLVDPYTEYSEEDGDISIGEAYAARIIGAVMALAQMADRRSCSSCTTNMAAGTTTCRPSRSCDPTTCPPEITVPPDQPGAYDFTGFRVPCVVISPFAKRNFVSHVVHEHTSLLKFVETKWNLPAMTYRDANAGAMLEFFEFSGSAAVRASARSCMRRSTRSRVRCPRARAAPGFHPIATAVSAASLPPAKYRVHQPPRP